MRRELMFPCAAVLLLSLNLAASAAPTTPAAAPTPAAPTTPEDDVRSLYAKGAISASAAAQRLNALPKPQLIGSLTEPQASVALKKIGERQGVKLLPNETLAEGATRTKKVVPWKCTEHSIGFFPLITDLTGPPMEIKGANLIEPDRNLEDKRILVKLDYFGVHDYPGDGEHIVLLDFKGTNVLKDGNGAKEDLHFQQQFRGMEGQSAAAINYPVFVGLYVPYNGVLFSTKTINISNTDDEKLLTLLDNDVFKQGLTLLNNANPVLPMVTSVATKVATQIGARHRSLEVQRFDLGLDIYKPDDAMKDGHQPPYGTASGARLAQGSYIIVQYDVGAQGEWDWSKWKYDPRLRAVVDTNGNKPPNNFIIFSVTEYKEPPKPKT